MYGSNVPPPTLLLAHSFAYYCASIRSHFLHARRYPPLVHQLAPGAQVWAGEDGPVGGGEDGTCGQNNSVCGTYATVPWYANDLGHRAVLGFSQYQRQDLLGGRYSLLGSPHDNEFLGRADAVTIHPDFWVGVRLRRTALGHTLHSRALCAIICTGK